MIFMCPIWMRLNIWYQTFDAASSGLIPEIGMSMILLRIFSDIPHFQTCPYENISRLRIVHGHLWEKYGKVDSTKSHHLGVPIVMGVPLKMVGFC